MPSNDNIVREYIQGDVKDGQMFDAKYVDRMETGIEASFRYSNYLEEHIGTEITNTKNELKTYTDNAKTAAINHTNTEINKARTDLTAYTDTAKAEAKLHTDTSVNNLRTELKKYTDTAEADSNKYTDNKVADLKVYTETEITEAKTSVKNDLLNGAGAAYDTLKELGDLIDTNKDAIDALEEIAAGKQNTITGAASTITSNNLTVNRALVSNGSGKVAISAITSTELGYLDGVTSNLQTQLNDIVGNTVKKDGTGATGTWGISITGNAASASSVEWNNVKNKTNASTSSSGLMTAAMVTKLNNISENANNYSLPTATSSTLGGVKIGYAENGQNYPVELNTSGQMYVNVPWTDTVVTGNYLPLSGGTLTGTLVLPSNFYTDDATTGGIDCRNSNIIKINGLYFSDAVDGAGEGIHFVTGSGGTYDTIFAQGGVLKFVPNRVLGTVGTAYVVLHSNNYTSYTVTKTGGGASGTWGINISGSAASCSGNAATATTASGVAWANVSGKPSFATVATSGSYNDLSNKPTIPAALGFTPIQQGGGTGQLTNKIYIGWSGSQLKAQVDSTDMGTLVRTGGTAAIGSTTQPVYIAANGVATACSYTLGKSVPSNAVFTDTVYTLPNATSSTLGGVKVGSNITVSSGTISLTKANVIAALGYTPQATLSNANTASF